jgi:hypothetical protein
MLTIFLFSSSLLGQHKIGVELRVGPDFATTELGDADLKTGFGFEGLLDYQFTPHLGVYAGWGWNRFAADRSFAGDNMDFEETGYLFGLQFATTGTSALGLYVRTGGILNHIEVENSDGDIIADSKHGLGFRMEAGLDIGLGSNWYLRPGVKYQALSRDITVETVTTAVNLNYFNVGLGIAKWF